MRLFASIALMLAALVPARAEEIRVLAAGSLRGALTAVATEFEKSRGDHVTLVFGPAGALRDRIIGGVAFDVYATAAFPQARSLTEKGLARPSVLLARNKLCAVVQAHSAITRETLVDSLLDPAVRPGTSTPKSDPAGDYAWSFFRRIDEKRPGAFDTLTGKAKILFGGGEPNSAEPRPQNQPLTHWLDEGAVDLLLVYCSGATPMAEKSAGKYRAFPLPELYDVAVEYGVALSPRASAAALDFFLTLLSPSGQAALRHAGFVPIAEPASER
ncbi:substrate-binding domain-containing protein [Methylosinus sp. R-45379]|uniref:substrate-binding domain-containing protein n=1 Tax=Methylosinus sp. R-45379 TaxID=980563 RepID=UPI0007C93A11|nr:substrate-binding domain-containing protein [Methylosinus sp. R-45379]